PRAYQGLEAQIKKEAKAIFQRGTVDVYIHRRALKASQNDVHLNLGAAEQWMKNYKKLGKHLGLESEITIKDVASLPDVFTVSDQQTVSEKEKKVLLMGLKSAIKKAQAERLREGKALKVEVTRQLNSLASHLKEIRKQASAVKPRIEARLKKRLGDLISQEDIDPQRQAQEVAVLVDKGDISEEIVRLDEHLKRFKGLLKSEHSVGKKLDFYCQELLREFNTIGSKSSFAELTAIVLDAKSGVESLREQVQNIE
ncbi:MAG: YicC/YloC family endoribonuclease, partial [Pseudomonadota bacterium]